MGRARSVLRVYRQPAPSPFVAGTLSPYRVRGREWPSATNLMSFQPNIDDRGTRSRARDEFALTAPLRAQGMCGSGVRRVSDQLACPMYPANDDRCISGLGGDTRRQHHPWSCTLLTLLSPIPLHRGYRLAHDDSDSSFWYTLVHVPPCTSLNAASMRAW